MYICSAEEKNLENAAPTLLLFCFSSSSGIRLEKLVPNGKLTKSERVVEAKSSFEQHSNHSHKANIPSAYEQLITQSSMKQGTSF
jgi:hypothetical protein